MKISVGGSKRENDQILGTGSNQSAGEGGVMNRDRAEGFLSFQEVALTCADHVFLTATSRQKAAADDWQFICTDAGSTGPHQQVMGPQVPPLSADPGNCSLCPAPIFTGTARHNIGVPLTGKGPKRFRAITFPDSSLIPGLLKSCIRPTDCPFPAH